MAKVRLRATSCGIFEVTGISVQKALCAGL
jgi:hypothetical protein